MKTTTSLRALVALCAIVSMGRAAHAQITMVRNPAIFPACTATALGSACDPIATPGCAPAPGAGTALVVDGAGTGGLPRAVVLGGVARYPSITVRNCGRIYAAPYNRGGDPTHTGILQLVAQHVTVDATSAIVADGAGYAPDLCRDGDGPGLTMAGQPLGGFGGCRLLDSAGGGGHFGAGGRGTTDCALTGCVFPGNWEQACTGALPNYSTPTMEAAPAMCPSNTSCRTGTGTLSNAGLSYFHSIYTLTMGAAGGDAGCRDGDGYDHYTASAGYGVGGFGGGSLAIVGLVPGGGGTVDIAGYVTARGGRGCAWDNDSGGGGAGGTVLIVGDTVTVESTAVVDARGGPGGSGVSTGGSGTGQWWNTCGPSNSTICDDCGGGGGGGIINVQSRSSTLSTSAFFLADGGPGGGNFDGCTVCQGEAGGGAGEIQLDGAYVGEVCDGFDNDFNGTVDDGFGTVACGLGTCATTIPACMAGAPVSCAPASGPGATCMASRGTARPRVAVILDSSGSMLGNLAGTPSFGDGSADHPGIDLNGDGVANDSRLFLAKDSLSQLISAYPEIDFALSRYHQDEGLQRACQTAKWFECGGNCCSYDNPRSENAASPVACVLTEPTTPTGSVTLTVHDDSTATNHCINYAGTCGSPRRGADILVGFESDVRQYLRWLDGTETAFDPGTTPGNFCNGLTGNCELRATGPTPLAGSLQAVYDYVTPIQTEDPAAACRGYSVILVSDGGEDCGGDPAAAAAQLYAAGIRTYVIGVSVDASEGTTLNAIAAAGHTGTFTPVNSPDQLLPAFTRIVSGSIHTEVCNGLDDNCNGLIDEGFNVGAACDNGMTGVCRGTGHLICNPTDVHGTVCHIDTPGGTSHAETCNGIDDNCNGLIDEGDPGGGGACGSSVGTCHPGLNHCEGGTLVCVGATGPSPEACDGLDNDCDGTVDNGVPAGGPCGSSVGECRPGMFVCEGTMGYVCHGGTGPSPEVCDGLDNDCDGTVDNGVPGTGGACATDPSGAAYCHAGVVRCVAGALRCQGAVPFHAASCTCTPDPCAATTGDGGGGLCPTGSACITCACRTPCATGEFPCSGDLVCRDGFCVPTECGGTFCTDTQTCVNNACVDRCATITCPTGQACTQGRCVENDCYGLGCPAGQVCRAAMCEANPCTGVTCAADQFCRSGACVATCEGVQCLAGQSCHNGTCGPDPCAGLTCPSGQICSATGALDGGTAGCVTDPCLDMSCSAGRVCSGGHCVDDPCAGVTCPGDPAAVVCRNGECVSRGTIGTLPSRMRVVASGGGGVIGCSVPAAPGSSGAPRGALAYAVVALGAAVAGRRRLRTARASKGAAR